MTVYKKQDIPERYHFKNHYRVPPLLLLADEGYAIVRVSIPVNILTKPIPIPLSVYIAFRVMPGFHHFVVVLPLPFRRSTVVKFRCSVKIT